MMKQLTVYGLAFLFVITTSTALAGGRGHSGRQHYRHGGYHFDNHRQHPRHAYRSGYRGGYYRPGYHYPPYLGAALLGSALASSLYHNHNGSRCYDNHSADRYQQQAGRYSEVVGCHRIERLADGSERRVEMPMSQCQ